MAAELLPRLAAFANEEPSGDLKALYELAALVHQQQDAVIGSRQQPIIAGAEAVCRKLRAAVASAALFSANEEEEDVATADLRYVLADFFLAELLGSCPAVGDPAHRTALIKESVGLHTAFLQHCHQYGLMGPLGKRIWELEEEHVRVLCGATCSLCACDEAAPAQLLTVLDVHNAAPPQKTMNFDCRGTFSVAQTVITRVCAGRRPRPNQQAHDESGTV